MLHIFNSVLKKLLFAGEKNYSQDARGRRKSDCTPTYILIAKDLENPNEQVFEAAVYYLKEITSLKAEQKVLIEKIFEEYSNKDTTPETRKNFIKNIK